MSKTIMDDSFDFDDYTEVDNSEIEIDEQEDSEVGNPEFFDSIESDEDQDEDLKTEYIEYAKKIKDLPEELMGLHPAEIAALYPQERGHQVGGSDDQILKDLRRLVFKVPLMPRQEVRATFEKLDAKVYSIVHEILKTSDYYYEQAVQVVVKVAAGNTYGKNIYEKTDVPKEDTSNMPRDLFKDHEIEFMKNAYDLLLGYSLRTNNINLDFDVISAFEKCLFIRGEYIEILSGFVSETKNLEEAHWLSMEARIRGDEEDYARLHQLIEQVETKIRVRKRYFGLLKTSKNAYDEFQNVRSRIIAPYLRSVYSTAKKTAKNSHQMLDNFQNGSIGLMRAVSCYSTKRQASFASVAKSWIKQMILLSIKEDANFVKLPVSTWQTYTQLEKAKQKIGSSEDDIEKIAKMANVPFKKAKVVYDTVKIAQVYSLNRTYDADEKLSLEDIMTNEDKIGYEGEDFNEFLREYCAVAGFTYNEKIVLALRHGMLDLLNNDCELPIHDSIQEAKIQGLAALGYNYRPYKNSAHT